MPNYRRARTPGGTYFFTLVSYQRQKFLCNDHIRTALRDALNTTRTNLPFTIDAMVLMPDHLHAVWTLPEDDGDYSTRWSMIKRLVTQRVGESGAHGAPYVDGNIVNGAHGSSYGIGGDVGDVHGAHGAPYPDDADRKIYGGKPRFVGCAMRTDINIGRDDDFVGCAVRTDKPDDSNIRPSRLKRREGAIWQRRFWEHQVRDDEDLNRCVDYLHWNPVKHGYVNKVADWPYSSFHRFVHEGIYPEDWGGAGVGDGSGFGE